MVSDYVMIFPLSGQSRAGPMSPARENGVVKTRKGLSVTLDITRRAAIMRDSARVDIVAINELL
ncbi:MAG TPA: hypothetical protein VIV60_16220 [Polyangiaceae bacterium]